MSEYIISEIIYSEDTGIKHQECRWLYTKESFDFKIDLQGNVYVKSGCATCDEPTPIPNTDYFSIIDNIQIPAYIVNVYKELIKDFNKPNKLINPITNKNYLCDTTKVYMFFDIVRKLKNQLNTSIHNI